MKRIKILFVTQAVGGVETSLLLIFRFLTKEKYELHLICPPHTGLATKAADCGVCVHPVKLARSPHPFRDFVSLFSMIRILKKHQFDIVHAQSAKAGFLSRLACQFVPVKRVIYSPRAFSYLSQRGLLYKLFLFLERLAVKWTDILIAVSESEKIRAISEVHYDKRKVAVIPNSIDPDILRNINIGRDHRGEGSVLTIGRLGYQKNPMMFLDLVELICCKRPDTKFVMKGSGYLGHLEKRVKRRLEHSEILRRHCEILPWSTQESTWILYERCCVFVLTSQFEGMPNTVLEAMMYGKPVVATNVDGTRDLVVHGVTGFLVSLSAVETMAKYLLQLLEDDHLRTRMGRAGHLRVKNLFQADVNMSKLEEIYDQCSPVPGD